MHGQIRIYIVDLNSNQIGLTCQELSLIQIVPSLIWNVKRDIIYLETSIMFIDMVLSCLSSNNGDVVFISIDTVVAPVSTL